jgi:nickel superoxide dismutase
MEEIQGLAGKGDAQSANQLVRWITTKEDHATKTQQVIAQYFMTQRIKADGERYEPKLKTAHAVMVQAMNCKQTTEPAEADQLKAAILAFHQAYEGKKK